MRWECSRIRRSDGNTIYTVRHLPPHPTREPTLVAPTTPSTQRSRLKTYSTCSSTTSPSLVRKLYIYSFSYACINFILCRLWKFCHRVYYIENGTTCISRGGTHSRLLTRYWLNEVVN